MKKSGQTKSIQTSLAESLTVAIKQVFEIQCMTNVKPKEASDFRELEFLASASLKMISDTFSCTVSLAFPRKTFLKTAKRVFGSITECFKAENRDLAAELLNMIYGRIKTKFVDELHIPFKMAIPKSHPAGPLPNLNAETQCFSYSSDLGDSHATLTFDN